MLHVLTCGQEVLQIPMEQEFHDSEVDELVDEQIKVLIVVMMVMVVVVLGDKLHSPYPAEERTELNWFVPLPALVQM